MKKLLLLLTLTSMLLSSTACSSSSYSDDDSWKSKKWNDLSGSEKGKAYDYYDSMLKSKGVY